MLEITTHFERVYVINLERRPDRLATFLAQLNSESWPFDRPQIFRAIDGDRVPCPPEFAEGGGAFGCRQSHLGILQQCLMDGVDSVLILEDDARLLPDFAVKVCEFLTHVPADWEGLYLGGQHIRDPWPIKPGIVRATDVERTHAYACRGRYLRDLYARWAFAKVHIDWMMRDWQHQYRVYCPERFLIAQAGSKSDISGRFNGTQSWNPATGLEPVVVLQAPREVAEGLRRRGLHFGYNRDPQTGCDVGLQELMQETQGQPMERIRRLSEWIKMIQAEAAAEPGMVCAVWHPECDAELVASATSALIKTIVSEALVDAIDQLPNDWGSTFRLRAVHRFIVLLHASSPVVQELRYHGFHTGFWRNEEGIDHGLSKIFAEEIGSQRLASLRQWIQLLQSEAETIPHGVVAVLHPEAKLIDLQAVTDAEVIEIDANTAAEALSILRHKMENNNAKALVANSTGVAK